MMWRLSANLMSNGLMLATETIVIGFDMPLISRENESLPVLLAHETMRHTVAC